MGNILVPLGRINRPGSIGGAVSKVTSFGRSGVVSANIRGSAKLIERRWAAIVLPISKARMSQAIDFGVKVS